MAARCSFKDGGRRCSRNGFGDPPLCRAHLIQASVDGKHIDLPDDSPLMDFLHLADRAFSQSNSDIARQVGNIFGVFLQNPDQYHNPREIPPDSPPRTPPPPPQATPDPRQILGFEPGEQLTAARVKARKRELAKLFHPDREGGSISAMKRVNEAADDLLKSL